MKIPCLVLVNDEELTGLGMSLYRLRFGAHIKVTFLSIRLQIARQLVLQGAVSTGHSKVHTQTTLMAVAIFDSYQLTRAW
jgi:hypothetical protein